MIEPGNDKKPNRLVHSTSPYLLQHAYNPVNWFEWSGDALEKAKSENKPILVSIGYSSCHWCHVMERESFENNDIAAIMNEHFVCIKVDREERPDIDQVYMDAVQALGINGGWPLNVFLTPSQQPFYGGTYFPPGNWSRLLLQINKTFEAKRKEIDESAGQILDHLNTSDLKRFAREEKPFDPSNFDSVFRALELKYDSVWGGMDKAPKFVMPSIWRWLLRYHQATKNGKASDMVVHTLSRLAMGGIYDQVGGGFSRYSVDREWFAPHFEKMLYDNAQLLSLYSEAFRVRHDPAFKRVASETISFLEREMMHPDGGFYSALDADSEGVEGKFYTWTHAELNQALGERTNVAVKHFNISEEGNWEHGRNILCLKDPAGLATDKQIEDLKSKLLEVRNKRIRPGLDDKILTGWNGMTIAGLIDCYNAFGEQRFLESALNCMTFLEKNLIEGPRCWRSYRGKRGTTEGFLEDYAFTIGAYTALYQATWEEKWLSKAEAMCRYVDDHFWDPVEGYFFFTGASAEKLIARKKEIFDNVIPSSNSVMARNLHYLGTLLDKGDWKQKAIRMATSLKSIIVSEPSYASNWATLALEITFPFAEIAIVGKEALALRKEFTQKVLFNGVVLGTLDSSLLPLLMDKSSTAQTTIYVCFDKSCKRPVHTVNEALELLEQSNN